MLSTVWFPVKKKNKSKILRNIHTVMFSFQDTRHHPISQATKRSNHERLAVTTGIRSGLRPFQGRRYTPWNVGTVVTAPWSLAKRSSTVLGGTEYCAPSSSHRKKSGDRRGHAVSAWLPIHLHGHVAFNHCQTSSPQCTEAASQLEAHDQGASVEQFPENHNIAEQSTCRLAQRSPRQCPGRF
jgi:hypothetical protein